MDELLFNEEELGEIENIDNIEDTEKDEDDGGDEEFHSFDVVDDEEDEEELDPFEDEEDKEDSDSFDDMEDEGEDEEFHSFDVVDDEEDEGEDLDPFENEDDSDTFNSFNVEDAEDNEDNEDSDPFEEEDTDLFEEDEEPDNLEPARIEPKLGADTIEEFMNLDKSKYTIERGYVLFTEISVKKTMNNARKDSKAGLVKSIQEVGILTPIHVMMTKEYDEYLRNKNDNDNKEFKGYKYLLLDGYRRIYNGIKVGLDGCYATIWNFRDKDYGEDFSLVLSAILNKAQKHSMNETWGLIQEVKKSIPISNRTLDSLFQLDNGDTNKLTEIMSCDYPDIIDMVVSGKKTISQAYNALKKLWDEEDEGSRDDKIGVSDFDKEHKVVGKDEDADDEEYGEQSSPQQLLSDEEVSEILGMSDKHNDEELMDEYEGMLKEPPVEVQDTKHRHPLDKDLKAETLVRDGYKCVCCGSGEGLPIKYAISILQSHHIISVGNGGPDTKENIITVCPNCHTLIHTLLWNNGVFSKKDFESLPEKEKERMRKVLKYASADYKAAKKKGKSEKEIQEDNKNHQTFKMPGTDLHENEKALKEAGVDVNQKREESVEEETEEMVDLEQGIE